ncbi:NAD-dependent protein deacetylase hst2-1 [Podosphaera aphanis]|nr:NAD-dependent protein deacetylase hst2-1 [Podosphaera aphanis]
MCQDHDSHDSSPFISRLKSSDINGIAKYIQDESPQKIVVMTGAGISTSAGIPDFRSPETGLYANLEKLDLPFAEAIFDISYFRENPEPFYVLAKELDPIRFYPTISHAFIALLNRKARLTMLFTQNIDCLERKAGVPPEKIVEAHGSFATQSCIDCKTQHPHELMKCAIENGDIPHCLVPQCNGLVKPDIVFFGESLPLSFFSNRSVVKDTDLLLIMGTSLSVQPFASLPGEVDVNVPRILINNEAAGDIGSRPNDLVILGDCDVEIQKLAQALGWEKELKDIWFEVSEKFTQGTKNVPFKHANLTSDEILDLSIQKLIEEVDASLKVSNDHTAKISKLLGLSSASEPASNNASRNYEA